MAEINPIGQHQERSMIASKGYDARISVVHSRQIPSPSFDVQTPDLSYNASDGVV